jgi:predicted hydrocarbon binding protein
MSHALIPTQVLGRDLPRELNEILGAELGPTVMYRLGYLISRTQAKAFFADRGIDPEEKEYRIMVGPFHSAWSGYGESDLLIWEPEMNENFIILWESDNSFCAREAMRDDRQSRACHLLAGYATGWCMEATGVPVETSEIACRAEGVAHCRLLVAHRDRIQDRLLEPRMHLPTARYDVLPAHNPDATEG